MDLLYIVKVIILFTIAIAAIRLMGKATLSQLAPHDLMAIVIIAALATQPIIVDDLFSTILAIALIVIIHVIFRKLTLYQRTNQFILGEPTILIKHGKIVKENLQRCQFSLSELLSTIRSKGYSDIRSIQYAILEPTGAVSVFPWEKYYPVTRNDLKIEANYHGLALSLVIDGKIQHHNLSLIKKDVDWLKQELQKKGFLDISQVTYASIMDYESSIYVDSGKGHHPKTKNNYTN
ncbi:DUF421 domain-containing protein [Shimazuella sp. AN120528]|uniref:DUF421 domain-containing protein n=1 Tax=Shimazuella soli TaxID=1892854 RepID=UPI001F116E2C|nr:YetF domain-containing protein [Shimazuella soli]MCH5583755.1 DUF421 domain-containing protein [Shimazuella soli]